MNLVVGAPWWLIALLTIALLAAAVEDAVRLRISNLTCAGVIVGATIAMALHGFALDFWQNAVVCLAILLVGMAAFAAGWLGGGDIKLLAAIGLWLDVRAAAGLLAAVSIAGGLLALMFVAARVARGPRSADRGSIPYGLAIVAGAAFIFAVQLSHRPVNPFIERLREAQTAKK